MFRLPFEIEPGIQIGVQLSRRFDFISISHIVWLIRHVCCTIPRYVEQSVVVNHGVSI